MRVRLLVAVVAVVTVLGVSAGLANPGFNDPVTLKDKTCTVSYMKVSRDYSTIVFGITNTGTVPHGFDIGGRYISGLIQPGQQKTIVAHFGPGGYRWACVSRHSTVKRGIFTIS